MQSKAWKELSESSFLVHHFIVAASEHGFCSGAQHQRKDRYMASPYDTGVFLLQNTKGASQHWNTALRSKDTSSEWPPLSSLENAMRLAIAKAVPTEAMAQRRLKEARGFGDLDGGGGVYKGKKKKQRKKN